MLVFSEANVEISTLPLWMQVISNVLSPTRGIAASRALAGGAGFGEIIPLLITELGIGLA